MACPVKRSSVVGAGYLLQGLGLVSLAAGAVTFMTRIGPIIFGILGVWLLVFGRKKSSWYECSECGTNLSGLVVKVCPGCGIEFPWSGC